LKTLDIITSAFNEEGNISELYDQLYYVLSREDQYSWSLIVCDNASTDGTWFEIQELCKRSNNVLGIRMARDFGFEGAIKAALDRSTADATVIMTSDLQDNPDEIPKFLRQFENGFDHVYQIVTSRPGSSRLRKMNSKLFYWAAGRLSKGQIKNNVSEFRLISRRLRNGLNELNERNRFLRGLVSWVGFNSIGENFPRRERLSGKSKANSLHVFNLGTKAILANSYGVLNVISVIGLSVSVLSALLTMIFSVIWIIQGVPFAGFGMLVSILMLGFGIVMLALGVIAQYLSLMYEEIKQRPNYLVMETTAQTNS